MRHRWMSLAGGAALCLALAACVSEGPGSDFDDDGLIDDIEDLNENFTFDTGETSFLDTDTDRDGLCDGQPERALATCTGCEDCNNNGLWEPCLGETDPLNEDTDNDGVSDANDPSPLDGIDCSTPEGAAPRAFGSSLPPGESPPGPSDPTPPPAPTATPTP